jgi:tetratricopeptide (TPR) repeat protein
MFYARAQDFLSPDRNTFHEVFVLSTAAIQRELKKSRQGAQFVGKTVQNRSFVQSGDLVSYVRRRADGLLCGIRAPKTGKIFFKAKLKSFLRIGDPLFGILDIDSAARDKKSEDPATLSSLRDRFVAKKLRNENEELRQRLQTTLEQQSRKEEEKNRAKKQWIDEWKASEQEKREPTNKRKQTPTETKNQENRETTTHVKTATSSSPRKERNEKEGTKWSRRIRIGGGELKKCRPVSGNVQKHSAEDDGTEFIVQEIVQETNKDNEEDLNANVRHYEVRFEDDSRDLVKHRKENDKKIQLPPDFDTHLEKAATYYNEDRYEEALEHDRKALKLLESIVGKGQVDATRCYHNIGLSLHALELYEQALTNFKIEYDILAHHYGDEYHPSLLRATSCIANAYKGQHKRMCAWKYASKALKILEVLDGDHPEAGNIYINSGNIFALVRKHDEALEIYSLAFKFFRGARNFKTGSLYFNRGLLYQRMKMKGKAYHDIQKALDIYTEVLGKDHPTTIQTSFHLKRIPSDECTCGKPPLKIHSPFWALEKVPQSDAERRERELENKRCQWSWYDMHPDYEMWVEPDKYYLRQMFSCSIPPEFSDEVPQK